MGVTDQIRRKYSWLVTFSKVLQREYRTLTPMPFVPRLQMWKKGFFSAAWFRYEFYQGGASYDYITDYQENLRASRINREMDNVYVDNKILFPLFFGKFAPVVENYAFINNNRIIPQHASFHIDSVEKVIELISSGTSVVVKPAGGSRGGAVNKIRFDEEKGVLWNNGKIGKDELGQRIRNLDFNIICPWVEQALYAQKLYPNTTNTIRVLTMIDPQTNEPFIAHAVQRIGTKHSYPVDNFAVGGLSCEINTESGEISAGSYIIPTESKKQWHETHPETEAPIAGVVVPGWQEISKKILEVADAVSYLKIIGWDLIALDNHEKFVLLEGNNAPCFKVHQLHGGLLRDERVKRFMKFHKVI